MRRLLKSLAVLAAVILGGTAGYYLLERQHGWTLIDSLYMSVNIVATVGMGDFHDLDERSRLFTTLLILCGVGAFMYTVTAVGNYLIAGELQGFLGQRRMDKKIEQLEGHFILCGYGRMGQQVADEFRRERKEFVVVDEREESVARAQAAGHLVIAGDAGSDEILRKAGIERARALVSAIDDDASNIMVTFSARALNEKLFIIARANVESTQAKLLHAGANRVLWPYGVSARRMAQMAVRPHVVEFLELVMHDQELELLMEEMPVSLGSPLDCVTIGAARIRDRTGATILAVRKRDGKMVVSPSPQTTLCAGDIAVALGTREQLAKLREVVYGAAAEGA